VPKTFDVRGFPGYDENKLRNFFMSKLKVQPFQNTLLRWAVGRNPSASVKTLRLLSQDKDEHIRREALQKLASLR
jgi:hypothetical protein